MRGTKWEIFFKKKEKPKETVRRELAAFEVKTESTTKKELDLIAKRELDKHYPGFKHPNLSYSDEK